MCFLFGVGKSNREAKGRSFPFTQGKANTMRGRGQQHGHLPAPESALGPDSVLCLVWTLHRSAFEDGHDKVPSVPSKSPCWETPFPKAERVEVGRRDKRGGATSLLSRQKSTGKSPGSEGNIGKGSPSGKGLPV